MVSSLMTATDILMGRHITPFTVIKICYINCTRFSNHSTKFEIPSWYLTFLKDILNHLWLAPNDIFLMSSYNVLDNPMLLQGFIPYSPMTFKILSLIFLVAFWELGIRYLSTDLISEVSALPEPYLNVISSGCFLLEVILMMS